LLALEAAEPGQKAAMMSIHMAFRLLAMNKLSAPFGFTADGSKYIALSANTIELDQRKLRTKCSTSAYDQCSNG